MPSPHRALSLLFLLLFVGHLGSQDTDYVLSVESASGDTGDEVTLAVELDSTGGDIQAWSFGLCHDRDGLELLDAVDGATTLIVNNGQPAEFRQINLEPGGFSVGVIICLTGCATLPPGQGYELNLATYRLTGLAPRVVALDFCETLGDPPVAITVVVGGQSLDPVTVSGSVSILGPPPVYFRYFGEEETVFYDPFLGVAEHVQPLFLEEDPDNGGFPHGVESLSLSLRHDSVYLVAESVELGAALAALNGGAGPEIFLPALFADGVTLEVVTGTPPGGELLVADQPSELVTIHYSAVTSALLFNLVGVTLPFEWDESVGQPPVPNDLVTRGEVVGLELEAFVLHLLPRESFVRGDANDDGSVNLADALTVLGVLFGGVPILCLDAADFNDTGTVDISDPIGLLGYLFQNGPPPAPPFPDCGLVPDGPASCTIFLSCP